MPVLFARVRGHGCAERVIRVQAQRELSEYAVCFPSAGGRLSGIVHPGDGPVGLIIVVGGPQYRVGSHRQFVLLCRACGAQGIASLRFDVSGMGDSEGDLAPFQRQQPDIRAAIDVLFQQQPTLERVVLWGLCDGASAILISHAARPDPRVSGMVLLNPWVRQEARYAGTVVRSYYGARIASLDFWRRLASGRVNVNASLRDLLGTLWRLRSRPGADAGADSSGEEDFVASMLKGLQGFHLSGGRVLVITSGNDLTAAEFLALTSTDTTWKQMVAQVVHHHLDDANHTFSSSVWRATVEGLTVEFLGQLSHGLGTGGSR